MSLKVVIIGGGSSYTPEIIEGFIQRYDTFPISTLVLVDIPTGKEKLEVVGHLAQRMIAKARLPIHLSWTFDRRMALQDADFVTTQIRVGGLTAREKDERIPLQYDVIGQETNGPGGVFKAFRTIPVLMDICQDMHEICPDAWLINFTNPAGIVTEALLKHSPHKRVIGVCNIPINMKNSVAEMMNCHARDVSIEFIGLNHFVFGRTVTIKGVDQTKEVIRRLIDEKTDYSPTNIVSIGWSKAFIQSLQLLPNPYHQYYFQTAEVLEKDRAAYQENGTRAKQVQAIEQALFRKYQQPSLDVKPKELEQRGGAYYSDAACSLMNSIYNHTRDIQTVNMLNQGAIRDLPDDAVIEGNAVITRNGPKPLTIGPLPMAIKGSIQQMKAFEELVIDAALTGDKHTAYQALMMNPLVTSEKKVKPLLDELMEAHQEYLPQFYPPHPPQL